MANCEMCGTETKLYPTLIEGVELNVCQKCAGFGKRLKKPAKVVRKKRKTPAKSKREVIQVIRDDYSKILRKKREKMGLKQNEFAKFLAEKESIIHKMESGNYTPSIELARKMENKLNIDLIRQKEIEPQNIKASKTTFTIGDVLKVK